MDEWKFRIRQREEHLPDIYNSIIKNTEFFSY